MDSSCFNYRLYSFVNSYLSPIQKGIQTAHLVSAFHKKYSDTKYYLEYVHFRDWSQSDKTIIVLDGGNNKSLLNLNEFIKFGNHSYPYSVFHEDEDSLNGLLTCVGVVLPEKVYKHVFREMEINSELISKIQSGSVYDDSELSDLQNSLSDWEKEMANRVFNSRLSS